MPRAAWTRASGSPLSASGWHTLNGRLHEIPGRTDRWSGSHFMTDTAKEAAGAGAPDPLIGRKVGNYRLVKQLGAGGMGVVYSAEHELMGKMAAVKMLLPELSANQDIVSRFFNEAKAATK